MSIDTQKIENRAQTVGAAAVALLNKADSGQSVIDTQRAMQDGKYIEALIKCAKRYPDWTEPFYICVNNRRERLLTNVIRNQFWGRQTRPMPDYDLALYWYDPKTEDLRFVWCVPDKQSVMQILENFRTGELPPEQWALAAFCQSFVNGTLV